jgi:hypothetical protein
MPELCAIPERKSPCFSVRLAVVPHLLGAETFAGIKGESRAHHARAELKSPN